MQLNERVPLFWDAQLLELNCRYPTFWNVNFSPHMLLTGPTGTGKTTAEKLVIGRVATHIPGAQVTVCDFKADDFRFLCGCQHYYAFTDCLRGLDDFYNAFLARQQGNNSDRSFRLLVFDEWASFLNFLDKKEAETAKKQLATMLMLGRSFNCHVLIAQQRADAEYFGKARDNFSVVVALGNLSKEAAAMFGFPRDEMEPVSGVGAGYMLTNGTDLTPHTGAHCAAPGTAGSSHTHCCCVTLQVQG